MDTHLKERLVGAAVLVAAAVILVPEMLSGPGETASPVADADLSVPDAGVRTFTIDLANRGQASAPLPEEPVAEVIETLAPPPEVVEEPAAATAPAPAVAERSPVVSEPVPAAPPAVVPAVPPRQVTAPSSPPDRSLPWVVQVGSFASQATADRLSAELKQRGYDSFVVPFKTATQTLYRVRIGPMQERGAADAAVQKLKREGTVAAVVANS